MCYYHIVGHSMNVLLLHMNIEVGWILNVGDNLRLRIQTNLF